MFPTRKQDKPDPVEGDRCEVEQVLQFRFKPESRQPQYEVKWTAYEHKYNSYINADDVHEQLKADH